MQLIATSSISVRVHTDLDGLGEEPATLGGGGEGGGKGDRGLGGWGGRGGLGDGEDGDKDGLRQHLGGTVGLMRTTACLRITMDLLF